MAVLGPCHMIYNKDVLVSSLSGKLWKKKSISKTEKLVSGKQLLPFLKKKVSRTNRAIITTIIIKKHLRFFEFGATFNF